jgi:glycosyltransferase involved in cell wall biosynthesis
VKIGLLYDSLGRSLGGVEAWMYHVAEELVKNNHNVCAYMLDNQRSFVDEMPVGVQIRRIQYKLPINIPGCPLNWKLSKVTRELRKIADDIDIFWTRSYLMTYAATKISEGRPVIYVQATPYPVYAKLSASNRSKRISFIRLLRWKIKLKEMHYAEKSAMDRSTVLVYLSSTRRDETLEFYGNRFSAKCHVIPSGVDLKRFVPSKRKKLDGCLKIVSVCRLSVEKNLTCVVRAVNILKRRGIPVNYKIVGEGPQRDNLNRLIHEFKLEDCISLVGRRTNIEMYLSEADIFVLPSRYEGFGTAYLEALACGLPCIALKGNPPKIRVASNEIIEHGKTGWLVDDNSPELMADTLQMAYKSPELVRECSLKARKSCEERFTWPLVIKKLLDLSNKGMLEGNKPTRHS